MREIDDLDGFDNDSQHHGRANRLGDVRYVVLSHSTVRSESKYRHPVACKTSYLIAPVKPLSLQLTYLTETPPLNDQTFDWKATCLLGNRRRQKMQEAQAYIGSEQSLKIAYGEGATRAVQRTLYSDLSDPLLIVFALN